MPTAKRQKGSSAARSKQLPKSKTVPKEDPEEPYPTPAEVEEEPEHDFVRVAQKNWLKSHKRPSKVKVKNDVLKQDIWDSLEREGFPYKSLLLLESLQTLERYECICCCHLVHYDIDRLAASYLWPGYTQESSNHHVLLIVLIVNVKRREHLETWSELIILSMSSPSLTIELPGIFEDRPAEFSSLFRRVLSMMLDRTLHTTTKTSLLYFLIHSFQNLDCAIVRKECAPLVSINIWHNLSADTLREAQLEKRPHLRKSWRATIKRFDAADEEGKSRLRFERSWLYTLLLDFLTRLYEEDGKEGKVKLRTLKPHAFLLIFLDKVKRYIVSALRSSYRIFKASCRQDDSSIP